MYEAIEILPIQTYTDSLMKPCALDDIPPEYDFTVEGAVQDAFNLTRLVLSNMLHYKGFGLSANQIGIPVRMFTINPMLAAKASADAGVFNPIILGCSEETMLFEEGCLSYPDYYPKIERPTLVRLSYQNDKGEQVEKVFDGLLARVILHEMDHLTGIRWYKRASKYHHDRAMRRRSTMNRKRKKANE